MLLDAAYGRITRLESLSFEQALALADFPDLEALCGLANRIRSYFLGKKVETCSIMNAKSGRCSENCKWCAQSAHWTTGAPVYGYVNAAQACEQARHSKAYGIQRFSLVTSGRAVNDRDLETLAEAFEQMRALGGVGLCGSFGLLTKPQLLRLKEAGMTRYHCNLETAPSKFPELCTTHTFEEKISTLRAAREIGLEICSGGIIGMGETRRQRVELAIAVRDVGAVSVPVNILQPIPGTPLANVPPLSQEEILRAFAIFRLVNPQAHIRFAGGRAAIRERQEAALRSGVSAILMGDMLTTIGSSVEEDFKMLKAMGYDAKV